jgi:hypothetical protein
LKPRFSKVKAAAITLPPPDTTFDNIARDVVLYDILLMAFVSARILSEPGHCEQADLLDYYFHGRRIKAAETFERPPSGRWRATPVRH